MEADIGLDTEADAEKSTADETGAGDAGPFALLVDAKVEAVAEDDALPAGGWLAPGR